MRRLVFSFLLLVLVAEQLPAQKLVSDNTGIADAYNLAVNTVDINTRRGVLAAGGDYGGEWTRDIAINSWNGVSLLRPKVAEKSLWSVTVNKDTIGHQYWDKIIWVIAAWNHYKVTGDKAFLQQAYTCSAKTMKALEAAEYDHEYGLFVGPSVFNDGIAAYPEPIYEPGNNSSSVLDHKNSAHIKCLSTNCTYYGAYLALSDMSTTLGQSSTDYLQKAATLKQNILKHLYNKENNRLNYLIDQNGKVDTSQEGLGISFAVLFGIVEGSKAKELTANAAVSKYGITSVYPDFPRYSADRPGRHNNIIWPMVSGFFADAAVAADNYKSFAFELDNETRLALDADKGDYNFREIYNAQTGKPDGGFQANGDAEPDFHWLSCRLQTWSATAYISMVHYGLAGMRLDSKGILFSPYLPADIHSLQLKGINYRGAVLNINLKGNGKKIKTFTVNGKSQADYKISSSVKGTNDIAIVLE